MNFRTEFLYPNPGIHITPETPPVMAGSCFAEHLAGKLLLLKYPVVSNVFGTLFSPLAIHFSLKEEAFSPKRLVQRTDTYFHYDAHSSLHATSGEELMDMLAQRKHNLRHALAKAQLLIITWGTAWVYVPAGSEQPVANCHKQPAGRFTKNLLSINEITRDFAALHQELQSLNPGLKIIITISPVRHIKDGVPEDRLSKSVLRVAAHEVCQLPGVHYFPAYEWITDDLRDYRFYKDDLVHPTDFAVNYVWERFSETFFGAHTRSLHQKTERWLLGLQHQPLTQGEEYRHFLIQHLQAGEVLNRELDLNDELDELRRRISQT